MELMQIGANSTVIQYALFTLIALLSFFMLRTALVQVVYVLSDDGLEQSQFLKPAQTCVRWVGTCPGE